ncbi:MAG: hypothetical protein PF439_08020 [Helicobacteraceae bacterium]|jgi:23S rRNA A2030 N6-methylase RlmJ|nr:hypothetical protein [Helicobacteraceae bacterium]
MKTITLSAAALMLLGTLTLGMAEDVATDITVDEQITEIQNAPAQERVRLMNQFKTRLATMNEADREEAITQLRTQTQTQAHTYAGEEKGEKLQTRSQDRLRVNQLEQTEQMQRSQEMNQLRGSQLGQQGGAMQTPAPTSNVGQ